MMVTERAALIGKYSGEKKIKSTSNKSRAPLGTSNWTEDYFTTTAGVTIVIEPYKNKNSSTIDLRQQLEEIFFRDYNSALAQFFKI